MFRFVWREDSALRPFAAVGCLILKFGEEVVWPFASLKTFSSRLSAPPLHAASNLQPHQRDSPSRGDPEKASPPAHRRGFVVPLLPPLIREHPGDYQGGRRRDGAVPLKLRAHRGSVSLSAGRQSGSWRAAVPPRRPWAAACGNWKTRRTAAPGKSTPPWRDHKWRPKRRLCTSTCCSTSVWKVGCEATCSSPSCCFCAHVWVMDCWSNDWTEAGMIG